MRVVDSTSARTPAEATARTRTVRTPVTTLFEVMESATCPGTATADILAGKWTLLLVRDLADGRCRLCELKRSIEGISPRTLSLRLRALEEHGIVDRKTFAEVPPRVEYRLTVNGL